MGASMAAGWCSRHGWRQKSHTVWLGPDAAPRVPSMTPDSDPGPPLTDSVEGGLPEPTELEPAPGSLALALAGPAATQADWEKAAAAVLRASGRMGDEPDDAVWKRLSRRTLDQVRVTPLGVPRPAGGQALAARPVAPGGRDIRVE